MAGGLLLLTFGLGSNPGAGQEVGRATAREVIEGLTFPSLEFSPPAVEVHEIDGVRVFYLEDPTLPIVDLFARFEGGYARFGIENYAAGTALPGLLRTGGTRTLSADSVDRRHESLALQTSFGGGGGSISASLNTLRETLASGVELWWAMVTEPAFDPEAIEVWRGREMESILRRVDDPGRLAFSEFNRLMYGDHPIGWEMTAADLRPERVAVERFEALHRQIVCRERVVLGVAGDVAWSEIEPLLRTMVDRLPPCTGALPEAPLPDIRRAAGLFLIPRDLDQSTIVLAHATSLRQDSTPDFFASRIGNSILGASGFSSRLLSRVRTENGFAYSAASLWTTPERHDGLIGATTRTGSETTLAALQLILEIMDEMRTTAPGLEEVRDAIDEFVNGFVFAFDSPAQIVSRSMTYESAGLPSDWLERYVAGIQLVDPDGIREVFARHLDPARFTILVVGDPEILMSPLGALGLGPVQILDPDRTTSSPSGSPRSRR
jgi:zinc protease